MECSYPLAGKLTIPNPDTKKIEEIDVLIDTGAEISFIGNVLIECLHLPVIEVRPKVSNADVDFKRSLKVSILTHSENDLVKPSILLISDQPSGESEKETYIMPKGGQATLVTFTGTSTNAMCAGAYLLNGPASQLLATRAEFPPIRQEPTVPKPEL
ncbi:hypothetical protein RB195_022039 [Necator americanus]|uniref:Peptidase A2 domain-containing protein n=1 Tax=Necator americanus TaxID=51031 RepID=A0ABR1EDQ4_NECAM